MKRPHPQSELVEKLLKSTFARASSLQLIARTFEHA